MTLDKVRAIARTVLYEGYVLYPYRRSTVKNQQRWTFGGLYPPAWSALGNGDASNQQVQCLVEGSADAMIQVCVRSLHLIDRQVGEAIADCGSERRSRFNIIAAGGRSYRVVDSLDVNGAHYCQWQEAAEREVHLPAVHVADLCAQPLRMPFEWAASHDFELLEPDGVLVRDRQQLDGAVTVGTEALDDGLYRVTVTTENLTGLDAPRDFNRDAASLYSMASTHAALSVAGGAFVSQIDPPAHLKAHAAACRNEGCFPVLVGEEGERDMLLSSPIILYDYPQIAPESPGDLFDGTEIDEILSLRILTMTDAEKREARATDPRARELLDRTDALDPEQLQQLHGAMRSTRPISSPGGATPSLASVQLDGRALTVGDRVRVHPHAGGDIMDMALDGKTAVIEGIDRDFEDRVFIAIALDDDPGRDLGLARMPGHRFFFTPAELEAINEAPA